MKKSKVYLQMFLAYMGILVISILIGMVIYTYAFAIARDQGERMNLSMLEMVKVELDQRLDEISKIAQRVAMDPNVRYASTVKDQFADKDQYMLYNLYRSLNNITISESLIQDVFVYFNNTQHVVSVKGSMSGTLYYDLYYKSNDFSAAKFREYMNEIHYADILMLHKSDGEDTMFLTMTNMDTGLEDRTATVVIAINTLEFQKLLDSIKWNENINILVLNNEEDMLTSRGGDKLRHQLNYNEFAEGNYQKINLLGESYAVAVINSGIMDWKYVTVIPEHIFEIAAIKIRNYSIAGLFACILLGSSVSWYFAKKNYNPIKRLTDLVGGYTKQTFDHSENELQWLKNQTEQFFLDKIDVDRILHENKKNLKNYYLYQLLESYFGGSLEELHEYDINLEADYNLVVVFVLDNMKKRQNNDEEILEMEFCRFVVTNIFKELILNYFKIEMVVSGQNLAAIINFPKKNGEYDEIIRKYLEKVKQITEEKFDFRVIALMGSSCQGLWGIHTSYVQASELREYVQLLDEDIIVYEDVKNRLVKYDYSMEAEQKIINAVKTGDAALARQYMEQVFYENISDSMSADTLYCLAFELMGTLLKGSNAAGSGKFAEKIDFTPFFSRRLSVEEIKNHFNTTADSICTSILQEQKENEKNNHLSKRVEVYIQDNYWNQDLNISIVAQYFDITPSYLSAIYKKQTGMSLLGYINTLRMDRAEELLKENYSVVEVAQMTGFRDSGTFIRGFKKKKGVTPGQLKKNM